MINESNASPFKRVTKIMATAVIAFVLMICIFATNAFAGMAAQYNVVIDDNGKQFTVATEETEPIEILNEANITLGANDRLNIAGFTAGEGGTIVVDRLNIVNIQFGDVITPYEVYADTVGEALAEIGMDDTNSAQNYQNSDAVENGMVIITLGTTNTYIAEELAGLDTPRGSFVTGRIYPGYKEDFQKGMKRHSEIVLVKGKMADMSYTDALAKMEPQDIVFKGANMLNYAKRQAAVCVGAPDGGTVAKLRRYTDNGRGRWICPVGLEKSTAQDLFEI